MLEMLWFSILIVTTLVAVPLGVHFMRRVKAEYPDIFASRRLPSPVSVATHKWPPNRYLDFILLRHFRRDLTGCSSLVRIGEWLFWLHLVQLLALFAWVLSWVSRPTPSI